MAFSFSEADLKRISTVLGFSRKSVCGLSRFEVLDDAFGRLLALEILNWVSLPEGVEEAGSTLVSVYAPASFLQLQDCTGFIASEDLGEVIFFARRNGRTSGLVVEREVGCSLYANVDERLLSTDFTQLPPELIMSSVALSMTETLFSDLG